MEEGVEEGVEGVDGGVEVAVEVGLGEEEEAEERMDEGFVGCVEVVGLREEVGEVFWEGCVSFAGGAEVEGWGGRPCTKSMVEMRS